MQRFEYRIVEFCNFTPIGLQERLDELSSNGWIINDITNKMIVMERDVTKVITSGSPPPPMTKDPGPKVTRPGGVETKTVGQLIDELTIVNIRIWMLIDKVMAGTATLEESRSVQGNNAKRNEYVRAIDRLLSQADIGGKLYG